MKTIELSTGETLVDFTPQDNQPKGIVHIATIKRLAALLDFADFKSIRQDLMVTIANADDLKHLVEITEDFVNFHKTINLIQEYKPESVENLPGKGYHKPVEPKVIGHVNLDE